MSNPQKENGYTAIANEIIEELVKLRIPASEKDICYFVIRKTYGFHKKEDRISLTQFEKGTLLSRVTIIKALKNLISRNILVKSGLLLKFNKNYNLWVVKADILVKSENIFGIGGYTKNGKGGYTYKRKKKTKEIPAKAVKKTMKTINIDTGEYQEEVKKTNKRQDIIKLSKLFDTLASNYTGKPIITPRSYFIVINAMNNHKLTSQGIEKLYEDWFSDSKIKTEDKVKMSFCLSASNINSFKVKN